MKSCFAASILALLMIHPVGAQEKRLKEDITCEQAVRLIQSHEKGANFVILDVRTPEEFNAGHLNNAENVISGRKILGRDWEGLIKPKHTSFTAEKAAGVHSPSA